MKNRLWKKSVLRQQVNWLFIDWLSRLHVSLAGKAPRVCRLQIYDEEGGVDVLLTILESYTQRGDHDPKDPDNDPDIHLVGTLNLSLRPAPSISNETNYFDKKVTQQILKYL